jgi:xanthine dehydrogenase accessory factor
LRPKTNIGKVLLVQGGLGDSVEPALERSGYPVILTELARPLAVRRSVAFAQAVFDGACRVEVWRIMS